MLRQAGKRRDGAATEQHAARLLARCEGATTPAIEAITAWVRLTPGELDTARQAAAGRTNKQIAGDLHLSVRTIEATCNGPTRSSGSPGATSWPTPCVTTREHIPRADTAATEPVSRSSPEPSSHH